jgi:hypothetical protein
VSTQGVSKIVVLHDMTKMRHPPFETTVRHRAQTGNVVNTIAAGGILLLTVSSVQDDVQLDTVEVGKGRDGALDDGLIEIALDVVLH